MSGPAVVAYLLSQSAPLTAAVPAARILAAPELPPKTALPAINVVGISSVPRVPVAAGAAGRLFTERVQVMVHAKSGASLASILALVLAALPVSRGTVNGVKVDAVLPDIEGVDLSQPEAGIFEKSWDFTVRWRA